MTTEHKPTSSSGEAGASTPPDVAGRTQRVLPRVPSPDYEMVPINGIGEDEAWAYTIPEQDLRDLFEQLEALTRIREVALEALWDLEHADPSAALSRLHGVLADSFPANLPEYVELEGTLADGLDEDPAKRPTGSPTIKEQLAQDYRMGTTPDD